MSWRNTTTCLAIRLKPSLTYISYISYILILLLVAVSWVTRGYQPVDNQFTGPLSCPVLPCPAVSCTTLIYNITYDTCLPLEQPHSHTASRPHSFHDGALSALGRRAQRRAVLCPRDGCEQVGTGAPTTPQHPPRRTHQAVPCRMTTVSKIPPRDPKTNDGPLRPLPWKQWRRP